MSIRTHLRWPLLLLGLSFAPTAAAAEVVWDGYYRATGYGFNSLSLSDDSPATGLQPEGAAWYWDHHLRLQPGFLLSDKVGLFTQVDLLPFVKFGEQPTQRTDPVTGEVEPVVYAESLTSPTTEDGGSTLQNIQVTRLWGELQTPVGQLRFGRVPVEWGTGMVFNAGNTPDSDFGDTADRIQFTGKAKDVYILGGYENRYEGFLSEPDDYRALVGAVYYQNEQVGVGTYHTYRWRKLTDDAGVESKFRLYTGDIWASARLGAATADLEFAAQVGGGDLDEGVNDLRVSAFGSNLRLGFNPGKVRLNALVGFAGGDKDLADKNVHTFTFDPDFDVALMMFEEPMPTLEPDVSNADNGGRTTAYARTGYSVSNALFLRPSAGYQLLDNLRGDLSYIAARQSKADASSKTDTGYGSEIDLSVQYSPYAHFTVKGTGGLFLPGKFYSQFETDAFDGAFDKATFGSKVSATIQF